MCREDEEILFTFRFWYQHNYIKMINSLVLTWFCSEMPVLDFCAWYAVFKTLASYYVSNAYSLFDRAFLSRTFCDDS